MNLKIHISLGHHQIVKFYLKFYRKYSNFHSRSPTLCSTDHQFFNFQNFWGVFLDSDKKWRFSKKKSIFIFFFNSFLFLFSKFRFFFSFWSPDFEKLFSTFIFLIFILKFRFWKIVFNCYLSVSNFHIFCFWFLLGHFWIRLFPVTIPYRTKKQQQTSSNNNTHKTKTYQQRPNPNEW